MWNFTSDVRVRYRVEHEKRNSISPSASCIILCLITFCTKTVLFRRALTDFIIKLLPLAIFLSYRKVKSLFNSVIIEFQPTKKLSMHTIKKTALHTVA